MNERETPPVPRDILVPIDAWTRLVFASKDTEDGRFRTLMEQAVMEVRLASEPGSLPLEKTP